ncbi:MAG: CDGSH iron-sulfur domain-containing protein [Candidatus Omnitrophica bacterium]|nr:CDGSH iron-sulfur domain-containing protein [Candidatus Omnitrophota bacterium]
MAEAKIPQKRPYVKEMDVGKYAWCSCGASENQPLCDGSHRTTDFSPVIVEINEKKRVAWCGCKQTKNPPYCDGSHSNLV